MTNGEFTVDPATGVVTGSLGLVEPFDSLSVLRPGPRFGTVTFPASDSYVYSPTLAGRLRAGLTASGDRDNFTVRVTGEHSTTLVDVPVPARRARLLLGDLIAAKRGGLDMALSPDGAHLYATQFEARNVLTILRTADSSIREVAVADWAQGVVVSADGSRVYLTHDSDPGFVSQCDAQVTC